MRTTLLLVVLAVFACGVAATIPKISPNWQALETDTLFVAQGEYTRNGDYACCPSGSNCEIQTSYQSGMNYIDYTNQRTRFEDSVSGQIIVTFFNQGKECLVVNNTCQEFCPTQGEELGPDFLDPNSTFVGTKTVNGVPCSDYQINQTFLGIIVMETDDVFVDVSDPSNPIPVEEVDSLTPFGEPLGTQTAVWQNFKSGLPNPSLFDIKGVDNCPESPNCDSDFRQQRRLRAGMWKTWAYYKYGEGNPRFSEA